jgi:hypothetical protein
MILHEDTEEQFIAKCLQELAAIKRVEATGPSRGSAHIEYLQEKSNQNEPIRVPQYERD